MYDVVEHDAERDVDVEREPFAIHGEKDGVIAGGERGFGDAVVFVTDDETGFLGVGKSVIGNGRIRQLHGNGAVSLCFEVLKRRNGVLLVAPRDARTFKPTDFVDGGVRWCRRDAA